MSVVMPPPYAHAQNLSTVQAGVLDLPAPGTAVSISRFCEPPVITGITIYPDDPLKFDFIIDPGDEVQSQEDFRKEANKLVKYFLATLTIPAEQMWVNLSPYEANRIIPADFGLTQMGRDLLAQDYMLKQFSASLMNPEQELGEAFWDEVYERAQEEYGTTEIPMNTFNKIWIVPEKADVYVNGTTAFVVDSHLKVMLEEDYLALENNKNSSKHGLGNVKEEDLESMNGVSSRIIKNLLLPVIEEEVNQGETFANLRQVYNSMILATWFRQNLQQSLLGEIFINRAKVKGLDIKDKKINQKIYDQYVESFKKGVYNFVREGFDPETQSVVPRKYFSGGVDVSKALEKTVQTSARAPNSWFQRMRNKWVSLAVISVALTTFGLGLGNTLAQPVSPKGVAVAAQQQVDYRVNDALHLLQQHLKFTNDYGSGIIPSLAKDDWKTLLPQIKAHYPYYPVDVNRLLNDEELLKVFLSFYKSALAGARNQTGAYYINDEKIISGMTKIVTSVAEERKKIPYSGGTTKRALHENARKLLKTYVSFMEKTGSGFISYLDISLWKVSLTVLMLSFPDDFDSSLEPLVDNEELLVSFINQYFEIFQEAERRTGARYMNSQECFNGVLALINEGWKGKVPLDLALDAKLFEMFSFEWTRFIVAVANQHPSLGKHSQRFIDMAAKIDPAFESMARQMVVGANRGFRNRDERTQLIANWVKFEETFLNPNGYYGNMEIAYNKKKGNYYFRFSIYKTGKETTYKVHGHTIKIGFLEKVDRTNIFDTRLGYSVSGKENVFIKSDQVQNEVRRIRETLNGNPYPVLITDEGIETSPIVDRWIRKAFKKMSNLKIKEAIEKDISVHELTHQAFDRSGVRYQGEDQFGISDELWNGYLLAGDRRSIETEVAAFTAESASPSIPGFEFLLLMNHLLANDPMIDDEEEGVGEHYYASRFVFNTAAQRERGEWVNDASDREEIYSIFEQLTSDDHVDDRARAFFSDKFKGVELVQPFRFPKYIWDVFQEGLSERIPGVQDFIKEHGLAWVDSLGIVHTIDEDVTFMTRFGRDEAQRVWQEALKAINRTTQNNLTDIDEVKEVVMYHEKLHQQLKEEKYRTILPSFRGLIEVFIGEGLTESHPLITSFMSVYGSPMDLEVFDAQGLVNWVLEEMLVLSIQEEKFFDNPNAAFNRLSKYYPDLSSDAFQRGMLSAIMQAEVSLSAGFFEFVQAGMVDNTIPSSDLEVSPDMNPVEIVEKEKADYGGIDFNPNHMELNTQGGDVKYNFQFDPEAIKNIQFEGIVPIIINVAPVSNIQTFIGEPEEPNPQELSLVQ